MAVHAWIQAQGFLGLLSYITWRSRRIGALVDGVPLVIVHDGRPIERISFIERDR